MTDPTTDPTPIARRVRAAHAVTMLEATRRVPTDELTLGPRHAALVVATLYDRHEHLGLASLPRTTSTVVASITGTTRDTAREHLAAAATAGLLEVQRHPTDRRSIVYRPPTVTDADEVAS